MGKDLISIIVPVYNVQKFLPKCLDSILCQSYANIEVIVVDDGSTDGSELICDDYAAKDPRITVIHQSNQGLSSARNNGLSIARGEYIGFVDSDDWISPMMYEKLHNEIIKYDADMANCRMYIATDDGVYFKKEGYSNQTKQFSRKESLISLLTLAEISNSACDKLYRRSALLVNPFPIGKYYEDLYSIADILCRCNRVVCIDRPYYYYYSRFDSIMHTHTAKHLRDHFDSSICRNKKIEVSYPELKLLAHKSQIVYNTILYTSLVQRIKESKETEQLAHDILEDMKRYPYSLLKSVSVKHLAGALLLRYFPAGFPIYAFAWLSLKNIIFRGDINRLTLKKWNN